MKSINVFLGITLVWLGLAVFAPQISAQALEEPQREEAQFVMIGHADVPETLPHDEIKHIFLGRMTRKDGQSLVFVILKDDVVYAAFLKAYVGKTIAQYTNYWKKQVFTGKGRMPTVFQDSAEILSYVAETEGAVGFLPADTNIGDAVHIITVTE